MTREEASKTLTQYIDYDAETPDYYEMEKVCKVALKALEQEPCEDAVISRNQAQNRIKEICNEYGLTYDDSDTPYRGSSSYALGHAFDNLPSVTPTRKKGKWIVVDNIHSQCMECGAIFCISSSDEWGINYCPNCGSFMMKED